MSTLRLDKARIAVLMGGWSSERDVSLASGQQVVKGLQDAGLDARGIDIDRERLLSLTTDDCDLAFVVLHGTGGEDGIAQAILKARGIPFTGSAVAASALAMDKLRSKLLWRALGLPTPDFEIVDAETRADALVAALGLPMFIKPANEGSSIGLTHVTAASQIESAIGLALQHDRLVFAERAIDGGEYTAAIVGEQSLPLLKIETDRDYYDFEAKYESDSTRYLCPCGLPDAVERELAAVCRKAFDAVGAEGWGRVDFMLDAAGNPWLLEINTVPGMTDHSLVPMAARAAGVEFPQLVTRIAELALAGWAR